MGGALLGPVLCLGGALLGRTMRALVLLALATPRPAAAGGEPNMNGEYLLSGTPKAPKPTWSTSFKDYPGGVESFTVYAGPIKSTYAEVFWTALPEVKLPEVNRETLLADFMR